MSKVKKQHYVPQFYLKGFTEDGNQLFVFDKFTRTVFKSNISNVATERYFYDLHQDLLTEDVDAQMVEKALSDLDVRFANAIDDVLEAVEREKEIDRDQRLAMAFFLTIQHLRTRESRNVQIELREKGAKALLNKIIKTEMQDVSPDDCQVRFNEKMASLLQAKFMFNPAYLNSFVQVLSNHIWFVGINETSQPLYTSDSPVVRRAHKEHPFRSYAGLASEGIEIAFPLTSKHVLVLCERTLFRHYVELDCRPISLSAENIMYYNSLQVFQSYRQIYCPSARFSLADRICNECPEVCASDRDRVEVI